MCRGRRSAHYLRAFNFPYYSMVRAISEVREINGVINGAITLHIIRANNPLAAPTFGPLHFGNFPLPLRLVGIGSPFRSRGWGASQSSISTRQHPRPCWGLSLVAKSTTGICGRPLKRLSDEGGRLAPHSRGVFEPRLILCRNDDINVFHSKVDCRSCERMSVRCPRPNRRCGLRRPRRSTRE